MCTCMAKSDVMHATGMIWGSLFKCAFPYMSRAFLRATFLGVIHPSSSSLSAGWEVEPSVTGVGFVRDNASSFACACFISSSDGSSAAKNWLGVLNESRLR